MIIGQFFVNSQLRSRKVLLHWLLACTIPISCHFFTHRFSEIYITQNVAGKRDTTRNISCSVSFSSTDHYFLYLGNFDYFLDSGHFFSSRYYFFFSHFSYLWEERAQRIFFTMSCWKVIWPWGPQEIYRHHLSVLPATIQYYTLNPNPDGLFATCSFTFLDSHKGKIIKGQCHEIFGNFSWIEPTCSSVWHSVESKTLQENSALTKTVGK